MTAAVCPYADLYRDLFNDYTFMNSFLCRTEERGTVLFRLFVILSKTKIKIQNTNVQQQTAKNRGRLARL